jgi:hypothetical protein
MRFWNKRSFEPEGVRMPFREGRRVSRNSEARILALKNDNYEEYVRLAHDVKDKRLHLLLDKTGEIMRELGLKVRTARQPASQTGSAERCGCTHKWRPSPAA